MSERNNKELVAGLKALVAFIEANDDFDFTEGGKPVVLMEYRSWWIDDKESVKAKFSELARRLGSAEKQYTESFFRLKHSFSPSVSFEATADRVAVCERIVTGTRMVPAVPEYVVQAQPEREEEIVEWKCAPILAADGK